MAAFIRSARLPLTRRSGLWASTAPRTLVAGAPCCGASLDRLGAGALPVRTLVEVGLMVLCVAGRAQQPKAIDRMDAAVANRRQVVHMQLPATTAARHFTTSIGTRSHCAQHCSRHSWSATSRRRRRGRFFHLEVLNFLAYLDALCTRGGARSGRTGRCSRCRRQKSTFGFVPVLGLLFVGVHDELTLQARGRAAVRQVVMADLRKGVLHRWPPSALASVLLVAGLLDHGILIGSEVERHPNALVRDGWGSVGVRLQCSCVRRCARRGSRQSGRVLRWIGALGLARRLACLGGLRWRRAGFCRLHWRQAGLGGLHWSRAGLDGLHWRWSGLGELRWR